MTVTPERKAVGNQPLENIKEEMFAAAVAAGYPASKASVVAGYKPAPAAATRRAHIPRIAQRIREYRASVMDGTDLSEESLRQGTASAWNALTYIAQHGTSESARVNASRFVLTVSGLLKGGFREEGAEAPLTGGKPMEKALEDEARHVSKVAGIPLDRARERVKEHVYGNVETLRKSTA